MRDVSVWRLSRRDGASWGFVLLLVAVFLTACVSHLEAQAQASATPTLATSPRFELLIDDGAAQVDRTVSANATVQTFLQMYRTAGPRLGCRFVDASTMLTLSGARALTDWNGAFHDLQADDLHEFENLNRWLVPRGISVHVNQDPDREGSYGLSVVNLAGLERMSRATRIAGFEPYFATSGWRGYYEWTDRVLERLSRNPQLGVDGVHAYFGVLLGYPDRAILDYLRARNRSPRQMIGSDTPWTTYYECGVASFRFPANDYDDATIVATERVWGDLLEAIYTSPEMRSLEADAEFCDARRTALQTNNNRPGMGWWSDERSRLGLHSAEQTAKAMESRCGDLTDSHERLLRRCAQELARQIRADASPDDLLKTCRDVAAQHRIRCDLGVRTLTAWISRAKDDPNDVARALYEAARARQPDWCREALAPAASRKVGSLVPDRSTRLAQAS